MMFRAFISFLFLTSIFFLISTTSTDSDEEQPHFDEKNRLTAYVLTDLSFVTDYFNGDDKAAFHYIFKYFDIANGVILNTHFIHNDTENGEVHYFPDRGYFLREIVLSQEVFANKVADKGGAILNDAPEYTKKMLVDLLPALIPSKEVLRNYALTVFLTAKKIIGYNGFSLGKVCRHPHNIIAVSFYNCKAGDEESEDVCINTLLHELLHAMGARDSRAKDSVMQAEGAPTIRKITDEIVASVAKGIYFTPPGCFIRKDKFKKIILIDSKRSKQTVEYQRMLENSNEFIKLATAASTAAATDSLTKASIEMGKEEKLPVEPSQSFLSSLIEFVVLNATNPVVILFVIFAAINMVVYWKRAYIFSTYTRSYNVNKPKVHDIPNEEYRMVPIGTDGPDYPKVTPGVNRDNQEIKHRFPVNKN